MQIAITTISYYFSLLFWLFRRKRQRRYGQSHLLDDRVKRTCFEVAGMVDRPLHLLDERLIKNGSGERNASAR